MTQTQKSLVNQFRKITFDFNSNSMHEWSKSSVWQDIMFAYHLEIPIRLTAMIYEIAPEAFCHYA